MAENKNLREEQDKVGSSPNKVYDVDYFRTKFRLTTEQVVDSIREAKTNSTLELEEFSPKNMDYRRNNLPRAVKP